jgi:hypothetical protein
VLLASIGVELSERSGPEPGDEFELLLDGVEAFTE